MFPADSDTVKQSVCSLWTNTFSIAPSDTFLTLWSLREWRPALLSQTGAQQDPLFSDISGEQNSKIQTIKVYSRKDLVLRSLNEAAENQQLQRSVSPIKPIAPLQESSEQMQTDPDTHARVVEHLITEIESSPPRKLCQPINITPASDIFKKTLFPCITDQSLARTIRAYLCYTFWWTHGLQLQAAIRDLVWTGMFYLCYGSIRDEEQTVRRARLLISCLQAGRWPIGVDACQELIVLTQ